MTEGNPVTGRPYGGRDEKPDPDDIPGERPVDEDERQVSAPKDPEEEHETGSRAPEAGAMPAKDRDKTEPSAGIPEPVDAPSPADATEGDPPGGSVANQEGRTPDR